MPTDNKGDENPAEDSSPDLVTKEEMNSQAFSTEHVSWGYYAGRVLLSVIVLSLVMGVFLWLITPRGGIFVPIMILLYAVLLVGRIYLSIARMIEDAIQNVAGGS